MYLQLQDELLQMSNDSEMYRELLKRSIFEDDYDNAEAFKEKILEAEEANQIWECMQEFYDDFMESIQEIESDELEW